MTQRDRQKHTETNRDIETDLQTDREAETQTETNGGIQIDLQTDREAETQTETQALVVILCPSTGSLHQTGHTPVNDSDLNNDNITTFHNDHKLDTDRHKFVVVVVCVVAAAAVVFRQKFASFN